MSRVKNTGIVSLIYWTNLDSLSEIFLNKSIKPNTDFTKKKKIYLRFIPKNFCSKKIDHDYMPRSSLISCKAKYISECRIIGLVFDTKILDRNDYIINLQEKEGIIDEYTITPDVLDKGITRAIHVKNIGRKIFTGEDVFIRSQTVANKIISLKNEVLFSKSLSTKFIKKIIIYLDKKYIEKDCDNVIQEIKNFKKIIEKIIENYISKKISVDICENFPELQK